MTNTANTANTATHVYGYTTLSANSGRVYRYMIHFLVDQRGRTRFIEEDCEGDVCVRPFMLLRLLNQVYTKMNLELWAGLPTAKYECLDVRHPYMDYNHHPALGVEGKIYRLDHEVTGSWINNPHCRSMVRYMRKIAAIPEGDETRDGTIHELAYKYILHGYSTLRLPQQEGWTILFQPD